MFPLKPFSHDYARRRRRKSCDVGQRQPAVGACSGDGQLARSGLAGSMGMVSSVVPGVLRVAIAASELAFPLFA